MSGSEPSRCPTGHHDCPLIAEVEALRREVDQLREESRVDALTGLYNLRYLLESLSHELQRTDRTGNPTAFIMVDLDHFKRVNDTYGHEVGNTALVWAATSWRRSLRSLDILCRYGGEEFGVILPGTGLQDAILTAERMRRVLERSPVVHAGGSLSITASFGVDVYEGDRELTPHQLIAEADAYLLEAKAAGRNRVVSRPMRRTELEPEERTALQAGLKQVSRRARSRRRAD